jgi:sugar/nucleoside kinase (ribokinase family)
LTLGLNGNEANILARLLGLSEAGDDPAAALAQAQGLQARLGISEVVIHHIKCAALAGGDVAASVRGPYCAKPKKSTGAGDRFNAGYSLGLLLRLDARARLACATACSGFFVRQARSATLLELADFIETMPLEETK